jgi:hypothetical protein
MVVRKHDPGGIHVQHIANHRTHRKGDSARRTSSFQPQLEQRTIRTEIGNGQPLVRAHRQMGRKKGHAIRI